MDFEAPNALQWSKVMKGIFLAGNDKGELRVYGYHDALNPELVSTVKQPELVVPEWLKKSRGIASGYSGKLISFTREDGQTKLTMRQVAEDKGLVRAIRTFGKMLEQVSLPKICALRAEEEDGSEWLLMQSLASEDKGIALRTLGFDSAAYLPPSRNRIQKASEDFLRQDTNVTAAENVVQVSKSTNWQEGPEKIIRENLLTGNLQTAIDCCFQCGRTVTKP